MISRPYQTQFREATIAAYDAGWRQMLASMATGTGKTFCFSDLYEALKSRLPGKMLVLTHTEELVDQNIATLQVVNPSLRVDKEMAEHKANTAEADIIVASVKTLGRLHTSRLEKFDVNVWDKIIVDEAHHTPADSYMNILAHFGVLQNGTKSLLLGVTATTQRADGKALGDVYKKLVYSYSLRQAVQDGYLVKPRGYRVTTQCDLTNISMAEDDLNQIELMPAIDTVERNQQVVNAWLAYGENRKTVVYAGSIQHAQNLCGFFKAMGVDCNFTWGEDPLRKTMLGWHRNSEHGVLVNCQLLIEGYDDPSISCIVLAWPTGSIVKFTQMCGRATRLPIGVENLNTYLEYVAANKDTPGFGNYPFKKDCIILAVVDIGQHSLCSLPMLMGLPAGLDLHGHGLLEVVEMIEAAQEENPTIDFSKLKSTDLKQFIEEFNLFTVRFPKEVEDNSSFQWSQAFDGAYVMNIPRPRTDTTGTKPGRMCIRQNLLGKWEITGSVKNEFPLHGIRDTIEEAFAAADQVIRERSPESVSRVDRNASWMQKPATKPQWMLLKRLYKGREWPEDFTQGQAAHFISLRLDGKAG
jgi:superfamily II DNA or RNA helicase